MQPLAPPLDTTQSWSKPDSLRITQQRIQRQLAAVVELLNHNARYLEPFERAWIEHIIGQAALVTVGEEDSTEVSAMQPILTHAKTGELHKRTSADGSISSPTNQNSHVSPSHMNTLIAASRSLNSANSLLSCCHDRWLWLQPLRAQRTAPQSGMDDLQQLINRHRQRRNKQNSASSQPLEHMQPLRQNNTNSTTFSPVANINNEGSESSLNLMVDDTVEQWRQNAEDALNESTARLQGLVSSDKSPVEKQSPGPYEYRPHMTERRKPLPITTKDAASMPTYTSASTSTHQADMPLSQASAHNGGPVHTEAIIACPECRPHITSARSQQFEAYRVLRSVFQPTLHNSYDKETISAIAHTKHDMVPPLPLTTSLKYSSSDHHSHLATSRISGKASKAIAVLNDSRINAFPDAGEELDLVQREDLQTVSTQLTSSQRDQTHRSRGRKWLERQSAVLSQQLNYVDRLSSW